ncbi:MULTISPECIES: Na+/H+ antiporter family protein [Fusobacterium]|jgi:predicted histidine transporter YuiF (NhaC family)|uniref:Sodium:proton antiporter n=1 Tax=Fusobacterium varium ATCC 27725 TaxID=469618 RepID=A0ABM6U1D3_FUSVA|nr:MULTISPECIES: SLC13 family permease [Fusobacterium]AVQ30066.1 sodium:proton antiporter [Fusobacterium varium ATCC 27725]EES64913.1 Na+/H+ antiporter family protein [Fusobacterium varium ATCC 27725]MCD7979465.1 sodium:proton antiporter [Fusobacterium sp.]MCF0170799.1 sodium:proton antiporter [Fusobacterium varium]MCF2674608.1 sodium:proton antiporter [Fusobacterium varium]
MLFNPVILSVLTMIILCLLKLNVIFSMLIAALIAGITSGMGMSETMKILIGGMGGNSETALSYLLLGTLAVAINSTGVASIISKKIAGIVSGRKQLLLLLIAGLACFSQNLIPVHIAFIPILIPPLLKLMNKLKLDRRAMACSLTFGLKTPYVVLPVGFGLIFHTIVKDQISANGYSIELGEVWRSTWILGVAMVIGLLVAIFVTYRKDREYQDLPLKGMEEVDSDKMEKTHWITLIAALTAFGIQLYTGSLPLGALTALGIMMAFKVVKWSELDGVLNDGLLIMGLIAFIMLVAAGYGRVIRETGAIETLVTGVVGICDGNKAIASLAMLTVGLFITMGIGTSFGTVPILATIYVPLAIEMGYSPAAMIVLITAASIIGDAGSPASDSTLGPTSGLNADGQHEHIRNTCIATFVHFCIPLFIAGFVGSLIF